MNKPRAMRDVFIEKLYQRMITNDKIFFLSADFGSPALDKIRVDIPDRFINVGIAEQNLINVSAGLALECYTLFAYAIAPFITMRGTLARVSTLFMMVGQLYSPSTAGNGGFKRARPLSPSNELSSAVSSPQI